MFVLKFCPKTLRSEVHRKQHYQSVRKNKITDLQQHSEYTEMLVLKRITDMTIPQSLRFLFGKITYAAGLSRR